MAANFLRVLLMSIARSAARAGFCVCLSVLAIMAVPAAEAQTYEYSSVEVEGNIRIDTESVLRFADIPGSGQITAGELNAAFRRIAEAGLFQSFSITPVGNRIVITVQEVPVINEIAIEGNRTYNDEILMQAVTLQPQRIYNASEAETNAGSIAEIYRVGGRIAATVTPKIIPRPENRVDVVFEVIEGEVIEVQRISFVGNRAFSDARLRDVLSTTEAGLLRRFVRSDTLAEERIEADKQRLTEFYLSRGYIDFRINSVTAELTRARDAFYVVFNLQEGRSYDFGEVTITTELPSINIAAFTGEHRIQRGETYSPKLVEEGLGRMEFKAAQAGLKFVRVEPRFTRNDDNRTLDIELAFVQSPRIFLERIDIEGNSTTLDRVIRRQFRIVEGDPFNPREIEDAERRIRALGYFSSVGIVTQEGSSPQQRVVRVSVDERLTGSLSFGISYATEDGLAGTIGLRERNFLGRGQSLSFDISTGGANRVYSLGFAEPYFLDRDLEYSFSTSYQTTSSYGEAFNTTRLDLSNSLVVPTGPDTRLRASLGYRSYEMGDVFVGSSYALYRENQLGPTDTLAIGYEYSFDSRRSAFDAERGFVARVGQEIGLRGGGDDSVLRSTAFLGATTRALSEILTLSAELEGGMVNALGGDTRYHDRFVTHTGIMRGFQRNGMGPRDTAVGVITRDGLRGNMYAVTRLEARFPLGAAEAVGLDGGLFFDVGSVWGLDNKEGGPFCLVGSAILPCIDHEIDDSFKLRSTVGASLFWDTGFGPLRFNFSYPLQKEDYDRTQNFELTLSSQF